MTPSSEQTSTRTQLVVLVATVMVLAAACTEQTEQVESDGSVKTVSSSTSSMSSTTVLQGPMTTEGPQARAVSTIESSQDSPEDVPDLAVFAQAVGAATVVAQVDSILHIYQNEQQASQLLGPMVWAWSDGSFIYQTSAEGGETTFSKASLLDGTVVCETKLPIHHATERIDGTYVMAVTEQEASTFDNWDGQSVYSVPTFAVDCETGDSQPIASFVTYGIGEVEVGFVERLAGREFNGVYDAEGNANIVNEHGISMNGDDYAGYHTFSPDGSMVAYGDFTDSPSPHQTNVIKVRDTNSGAMLWESELDTAFARLHFSRDSLLVELFDPANDGSTPSDSVVVLDLSTGIEVASARVDFDLLYVGR